MAYIDNRWTGTYRCDIIVHDPSFNKYGAMVIMFVGYKINIPIALTS